MSRPAAKPDFAPLAAAPELSSTLPSWVYRDPDILEDERARIFRRGWTFAAHVTEIGVEGCSVDVFAEPVLLVPGGDGAPVAFHSACPLCASPLTIAAHGEAIACPRHSDRWTGEGRPRAGEGPELEPVRAEVLAGLVFVNMDPRAAGLAAQAPDLEASIRGFVPAVDRLVKCHETVHEVASNWKVLVENSLECYHCEPCHPGFAEAVDMARYRSVSDGIVTIHTSQRQRAWKKFGEVSSDDAAANGFMYWYVWPGTEIDASPGEWPRLSVFTRQAPAPDRHRLIGRYYRLPGDVPSAADKRALAEDATLMEDVAICEAVQRGLASRGYSQGRFIVDPERSHISEHSVHHFQRMVAAALELQ